MTVPIKSYIPFAVYLDSAFGVCVCVLFLFRVLSCLLAEQFLQVPEERYRVTNLILQAGRFQLELEPLSLCKIIGFRDC